MKRLILIISGVALVAVLAGAAYAAARQFSTVPEETAGGGGGKGIMIGSQKAGGGPGAMFSVEIKPAPELPGTQPKVAGLFVRRQDNSIFVGTGDIKVTMAVNDETGERKSDASYSGPILEVVVSRDTTIYRDETEMPSPKDGGGSQTLQQRVTPVESIEELGEDTPNAEIQVWGERRGDRVIAQVLVYRVELGG